MQGGERWSSHVVTGFAVAVAGIGSAVAALGPAAWFDWFATHVVGGGTTRVLAVPVAHRFVAVCGALLGGLGLLRLARRAAAPAARPDRRLLWIAAAPFVGLVAINVWWAGARVQWWAWPSPLAADAYRPLLYALGVATVLALSVPVVRGRMYRPSALVGGVALGGGYGLFSALWHCCPPLWDTWTGSGWIPALSTAGFLAVFAFAGLGMLTAVATRWPAPLGEVAGGALLAAFYPWHTPAWAAQCFVGGVVCTHLARRSGSYLAPGALLMTAYLTHMTVPFVGWLGVALAVALLAAVAISGPARTAPAGAASPAASARAGHASGR